MRVVLINSIYPNPVEPNKGNFVLKNLMQYPQNVDIEVIAPVGFFLKERRKSDKRVPFVRKEKLNNLEIRVWHPRFLLLPKNIFRALVPFFEYISIWPILWLLNKRKKIDVLHANFGFPDGVCTFRLAKKLGVPYVITEHQAELNLYLSKNYLNKMMLPAYAHSHKVIAVSEHTKEILLKHGALKGNIEVLPNGIDIDLFIPKGEKREIKKLIYVGYLVQHKGVQILLKALAEVGDSSLSLSIIGDGVYRSELESLSKSLGLAKQVSFLGAKNAQQVAELYQEHDALVHPSFIESFGITVIEAMACGLPVLATENGGSEYIVTEDTGIIVPIKDVKALAEGIKQLLAKDWERKRIREYATEHYDIRNVVGRTIALYPKPKHELSVCHLSSVHLRTDVRVFYKQCISLEKAGYKVHLVVADGKRHERKDGVIIHDVGNFESRKARMLRAPFRLLKRALYISADIYQIHDPELIPMAFFLKLLSRKPVIYDIHESYADFFLHKTYLSKWQGILFSHFIRTLEKWALRVLDKGITVTEHISEIYGGIPVIHNYPLLAEWKDINMDIERYSSKNICYLGSISIERGIDKILEAIENVDCTLHLAGNYEPPELRDELIKMPGFKKVVEYGYINRQEAFELLSKCAIGLFIIKLYPNNLYNLSTKMLEYMAAGLAILASNSPSNIELLDASEAGIYLDPQNSKGISEALNSLLSNPEALKIRGEKGLRYVLDNKSWESEQVKFLKIYEELLKDEVR